MKYASQKNKTKKSKREISVSCDYFSLVDIYIKLYLGLYGKSTQNKTYYAVVKEQEIECICLFLYIFLIAKYDTKMTTNFNFTPSVKFLFFL